MNDITNEQLSIDPKWLTEFAQFLEENKNKEELEHVKAIFIETFLSNIHDGMETKDALHNAKTIALGFSTPSR